MTGLPATLKELATGRLYIDGDPEVRLRDPGQPLPAGARLFLVVTRIGENGDPVGLLTSLFSGSGDGDDESTACAHVAGRVEAAGGTALHQEVEALDVMPPDVSRFMVIHLLRRAKEFSGS